MKMGELEGFPAERRMLPMEMNFKAAVSERLEDSDACL